MFTIPDFETIRDAILRDTQSLDPTADVSHDSDHFVHASRLAACATGQYAHQAWIVRQIFPDTADTAYLERHAALRGLTRRNATIASGTASIQGVTGSSIGSGVQIKYGNMFYRTTGTAQIGQNGTASVVLIADNAGVAHNVLQAAAQFMAAPVGVSSDCIITAQGGTDAETDASLLARLLEIIRCPPAGGNQYDYKNWALSVDGVSSAYVYPLRRGLGTVDIAITSADGAPSDEIIAKTQAYIDEMRPVTAKNVLVVKPHLTVLDVQVQVKLDGLDLAIAQSRVQAALSDYFGTLIPGDDLIVSQIEAAISNVGGISDRKLLSPNANRVADVVNHIEWFKLGRVNVSLIL